MRKLKLFFTMLTAIFLVTGILITSAAALEQDGAGNAAETDGKNEPVNIEGDYFFTNFTSGNFEESTITGSIGGDFISIGNDIRLEAEIGGNIRTATSNLVINNTTAKNATVASMETEIGENTKLNAVYSIGSTFVFRGDCEYLEVWASEVYIYGKVTNGAKIHADNVYFSDTCEIDKVTVEGANTPYIFNGEIIDNKNYTEDEDFAQKVTYTKTNSEVENKFAGLLYTLPASIILVLLICLIMGKTLDDSGHVFKNRPGRVIGLGFVGAFLIPIAIIFLFILPYTAKAGLTLGIAYTLIAVVSRSFTSASLARMIMPKINKYLSSLIGVTVVTVLSVLTIVNTMFTLFSLVYIFGYTIVKVFFTKNDLPPLQPESFQM